MKYKVTLGKKLIFECLFAVEFYIYFALQKWTKRVICNN